MAGILLLVSGAGLINTGTRSGFLPTGLVPCMAQRSTEAPAIRCQAEAMHASIREATVDDMEAVFGMIRGLAETVGAASQVNIDTAQLVNGLSSGDFFCLLAEVGGEPVGYALCFYTFSTWDGRGIFIEDLYLKKSARGSGLGSGFMRALAERALNDNCERLQWQTLSSNVKAQAFYAALEARERVEADGSTWINYLMRSAEMQELLASAEE